MKKNKKVVVIGGGTGTYTVLLGLKKYPLDLSAIVSMVDDGGSNKVIRDEFGLLPTSDIRQCIVALSSQDERELIRKLFTYRYNQGLGISGMTFGNLFMAALTDIFGNQEKAIQKTCDMLHVKGNVIPVTMEKTNLVARYENGKQILGEHDIDEPDPVQGKYKIIDLEVVPKVKANPTALKAIKEADYLIFGPGDLFTSVLPNVVIGGVKNAIKHSKAKKIFVINLMTKFGQTNDFTAKDFLKTLENYLGKHTIDYCFMNNADKFPEKILKRYEEEKAYPVKDDLTNGRLKIVRGDFVSDKVYQKAKSDKLMRSLIRHDSDKLAKALTSIF